ncbi:MAG: hypothetical protein EHM45_23110 [Desulfobacteraceae bacterium]|nr:MAG: hypothetical protein EHM45_23110 [Desulfobacteraceae bacterium]
MVLEEKEYLTADPGQMAADKGIIFSPLDLSGEKNSSLREAEGLAAVSRLFSAGDLIALWA